MPQWPSRRAGAPAARPAQEPYRRLQLWAGRRVASSLAEHEAVVEAILAGDGERAERVLKDHILIQGDRLSDFIASFGAAEVA